MQKDVSLWCHCVAMDHWCVFGNSDLNKLVIVCVCLYLKILFGGYICIQYIPLRLNEMSLLLGTDSKPYRRCCFHHSVPNQFIFNPSIVEFFIVMVAASSDVMVRCLGSAFFSTAGCAEGHFSTVKAVYMFPEQFDLSYTCFRFSVTYTFQGYHYLRYPLGKKFHKITRREKSYIYWQANWHYRTKSPWDYTYTHENKM